MRLSAAMVLSAALAIALAVLGHSAWHKPMLVVMSIITGFFTGGHVVP